METAPTPPPPPPEPSSLTDRLVNVIASPGELFAEIKGAPVRGSNWIVPLVLATIASVIYLSLAYAQAGLMRSIQDQQERAIQKQIAAGKLTQAQADKMAPVMAIVTKIFAVVGGVVSPAAGLFFMALVLWGALKLCAGGSPPYLKIVEVCGLALVIDVLQKLIRSFLVLWKENILATASPTIFLAHPSMTSRRDVFLSMFDVMDIWWLTVLSIGVSKVGGVSGRTAVLITFGIWFGFRVVMVLIIPAQS